MISFLVFELLYLQVCFKTKIGQLWRAISSTTLTLLFAIAKEFPIRWIYSKLRRSTWNFGLLQRNFVNGSTVRRSVRMNERISEMVRPRDTKFGTSLFQILFATPPFPTNRKTTIW